MGAVFKDHFCHLHPFLHRKERFFFRILGDGEDHLIKNLEGPLHDIDMTVGEGIKRPGVDSYFSHIVFVSFHLFCHLIYPPANRLPVRWK